MTPAARQPFATMATALLLLIANTVALTASLLIGASFLLSNPRSFNARVFAAVTLSSACYLLGRMSYALPPDVQLELAIWPFLVTFMNMGTGFWMILAWSVFQDRQRIPRWMISAFALQLVLSAVNGMAYIGRETSALSTDAYPPVVNFVFGPLPLALQSAFALLALYWAVRGWRADVDAGRRLLRSLFLVLVGGLSFGINVTELALIGTASAARAPFDNAITMAMAFGYLAVALAVLRFDPRAIERIADRVARRPDPAGDSRAERDLARLTRALRIDKVYLQHGLSIGELARHLAMPEYRLRALINKRLGYRNFNALLHDHRLRDACARLADPARAHVPILTIALEVGYQSITPFNQAFREAIGCTPSAYRRRHSAPA